MANLSRTQTQQASFPKKSSPSPTKINMSPKKGPVKKEEFHLPTIDFQGICYLVSGRVRFLFVSLLSVQVWWFFTPVPFPKNPKNTSIRIKKKCDPRQPTAIELQSNNLNLTNWLIRSTRHLLRKSRHLQIRIFPTKSNLDLTSGAEL